MKYEACNLAFYVITVGAGGVFVVAKTLQLLQVKSTKRRKKIDAYKLSRYNKQLYNFIL